MPHCGHTLPARIIRRRGFVDFDSAVAVGEDCTVAVALALALSEAIGSTVCEIWRAELSRNTWVTMSETMVFSSSTNCVALYS